MSGIQIIEIESVEDLLLAVNRDTKKWVHDGFAKPWFRGVKDIKYRLLPSILRSGNDICEFNLTKKFRLMAPGFDKTPETNRIDQWLFLMQHNGIPTRLLDWSESPLIACFFATEKAASSQEILNDAVIYAIDPIQLNLASDITEFPNTWSQNSILQTIKFAFGTETELVDGKRITYLEYPVAIYPSTIHARIASQKGCFTLHGNDKRDFETIFKDHKLINDKYLMKYRIQKEKVTEIFKELSNLGITYSSLFPDLEGLSKELKYSFNLND